MYDYDNATKQECLDDLYETLESLENVDYGDWETLERKGIRIQNCAKRLQELGDKLRK